jgi:cobyrinic acid a,c-diamide synthase
MIVVEGARGLFDHHPHDFCFRRDADLAYFLGTPVILVVDAKHVQEGIAPLVYGFWQYHPQVQVAGIIANNVEDDVHDNRLREAVDALEGPIYLGGIRSLEALSLSNVRQGSEDANPGLLPMSFLIAASEEIRARVDVKMILSIASRAKPVTVPVLPASGSSRMCPVAVADDPAFNLTVYDNLDLLRRYGAILMPFSPLVDARLPAKTKAVYLPGGYLHLYAKDLYNNKGMRTSIANFARSGGLVYAEGSSVAYLCDELSVGQGESFAMCGLIPGVARIDKVEAFRGVPTYATLTMAEENALGGPETTVRGVRLSRCRVKTPTTVPHAFNLMERSAGDDAAAGTPDREGYLPTKNIFATTFHPHWGSCADFARRFIAGAAGEAAQPPPPE